MLRRNADLAFAGGAWVFPGGRVDAGDTDPARPADVVAAARNAAAREALEEAGVVVDPATFVALSRWCPPPEAARRFDTWFFAVQAPAGAVVTIDGGEIHDHAWASPADIMARRAKGEIDLIPPTWLTLRAIAPYGTVAEALAGLSQDDPPFFVTRSSALDDGTRVVLWEPDAAYHNGVLDSPGSRHRLILWPHDWEYIRCD